MLCHTTYVAEVHFVWSCCLGSYDKLGDSATDGATCFQSSELAPSSSARLQGRGWSKQWGNSYVSIRQSTVHVNIDHGNSFHCWHEHLSLWHWTYLSHPLTSCSVEPVDAVMSVDFLLVDVDWAPSYWSHTLPLALCGSLIHNFGLFSLIVRRWSCHDVS